MKVSELMIRKVAVVSADDTIETAAKIMAEANVGILPVLEGKRLVGVVSDRDIVVHGVSKGPEAGNSLVGDVMTEEVHFCLEDDDIEDVINRMGEMRVRRMPVFDRSSTPTGIISIDDIAARAEWEHAVVGALRKITTRSIA
jgi:CBS domain-containing protein